MKPKIVVCLLLGGLWMCCPCESQTEDSIEANSIRTAIYNRQKERQELFAKLKQQYVFTTVAENIVNLPVQDLIQRLQHRTLSAVQVFEAFVAKSLLVNDHLNCIAEFIPFSLHIAQDLDSRSKIKGPLHGLPICVKDDHDVEGMDTTLGLGKNLYRPANKNSVLVQAFIDLGAVPFCKTNIPQTLFSYASENPIYGETLSAINPKLAPGGSSAGTASLVSAGGIVFGTGTDIAGSVRIPAHFSGLVTLKPTGNRLSDKGILPSIPRLVGLRGIPGIIAREVETVAYAFKALTAGSLQNRYDPRALPIPWNEKEFRSNNRLRIGYYTSLPFFPAIGDTVETVLIAKSALEAHGHLFVPFTIENSWGIMRLMNDVVSVDYGIHSHLNRLFENEPEVSSLAGLRSSCGQPDWKRKLELDIDPVSKNGSSTFSPRITLIREGGVFQDRDIDVWEMIYRRNEFISKILSQMEESNLDVLLTPAFPFSACRLNDTGSLFAAVHYTMLWNFADFPAGVLPFGKESGKNIDNYNDEGDSLLRLARDSTRESIGSPIGVQIVGKPYNEELVLRVMLQLQNTAMGK